MGLRGQVDSEAVLAACSHLGQSTLMVAGHEQVVQVLADDLCCLHVAQRLRRVAGTAKVHQQSGLGAGQEILRGGNDIGGSVGLDLVVVLGVQSLEQGVGMSMRRWALRTLRISLRPSRNATAFRPRHWPLPREIGRAHV